jgi:tetratricopeptide (TPR) repeat protein
VDLLYSLAQQWQMKGEHERALTVLDQCEALVPQIVEDKTFEALREASRQHLGTGKKVKPSQIVSKLKRASALRSTARIAPIALALAVGAYCVVAWIWGHYPKVFLVNGVDQPYQIKLAGKLYTLAPNSFAKASIAEGDAPLEVVDLPAAVPPEEISLHTSFLKRPFSSTVFVINPDRAAVLHQVRAYYGSSAPPPESKLFAGQTLHRFTGINCPFEKLPDSITTSHGGTESRVGLSLLSMQQKLSPHTKALLLGQVLGNDATVEALKRYLVFNPDAVEVLGALSRMVPAETLVEILRPRLADRPVRVDWHRMNQDTLSKLARDEECERQYNELLVASPDDPDLIYLAARASSDPTRSAEMCNKLIASGAASGRAHTWLCHYHLCGGRFREAIEHGAEAAKLLPDHAPTRANYVSALLADHQFEQALEASEPGTHLTYPDCVHWFREELYALEALGRHEEAERVVERLRRAMNMVENAEQMIRYVLADSDYARGDIPGYLQRMNAVRTSNSELSAAITSGSFDDAEKALADDGPSAESELLVYLAARLKGNHAVAERHLASAIQLLAKEDRDARVFATALEGDAAACETALDRAILPHEQKAIYLAALATVAGDARQRCLAMAEQLNTDLRFPHLLIKQTIESLKEPSGHDGPG